MTDCNSLDLQELFDDLQNTITDQFRNLTKRKSQNTSKIKQDINSSDTKIKSGLSQIHTMFSSTENTIMFNMKKLKKDIQNQSTEINELDYRVRGGQQQYTKVRSQVLRICQCLENMEEDMKLLNLDVTRKYQRTSIQNQAVIKIENETQQDSIKQQPFTIIPNAKLRDLI